MDERELDLWPKDSSLQKQYSPSGNIQPAPVAAGRDETPPASKSKFFINIYTHVFCNHIFILTKNQCASFVVKALKNKTYKSL